MKIIKVRHSNFKLNKYELAIWSAILIKNDIVTVPTFINMKQIERKVSDIVLAKELLNL